MSTVRFSAVIAFWAAVLGCELPPEDSGLAVVRSALVLDSYIFRIVQVVEIHVLSASTPGALACADLRGTRFSPEDTRFRNLVEPPPSIAIPTNHPPTQELLVDRFQVPANEPLIILARGLTKANEIVTVADGCREPEAFRPGTENSVNVDIKATTGAACTERADCQPGLECEKTIGDNSPFRGGYCTKPGCTQDQDCPPAARCVTDGARTLCLRGCESPSDCTYVDGQAVQDCVRRATPTSACKDVCVFPTWNTGNKCTL